MNAIWQALASLTSKERMVLALRFRHGKSADETGHALRMTQGHVRQLEASALDKLRERFAPRQIAPRDFFPR